MISLKRHIERHPGQVLDNALSAYRATLLAMGESGAQACPALGSGLRQSLANLHASLSASVTPEIVSQTGETAEKELSAWGGRAAGYYQQKADDVKEILLALAQAAETAAERDARQVGQFSEVRSQLQAAANLEDLAAIRQSIVGTAMRLEGCVMQMSRDTKESVRQLRSQVSHFQKRLAEADRLARLDETTGLGNRRYAESQIEARIAEGRPFSILILDLNGFKEVNDSCGHLAGDDLLKQFAGELRSALRATDAVARWGGDEFVAILDCAEADAAPFVERIRKWVMGDYTVRWEKQSRKFAVTAALGVAQWRPGETLKALFDRADASMYEDKRRVKESKPAAPAPAGR